MNKIWNVDEKSNKMEIVSLHRVKWVRVMLLLKKYFELKFVIFQFENEYIFLIFNYIYIIIDMK